MLQKLRDDLTPDIAKASSPQILTVDQIRPHLKILNKQQQIVPFVPNTWRIAQDAT
jgi:hypothetical protein